MPSGPPGARRHFLVPHGDNDPSPSLDLLIASSSSWLYSSCCWAVVTSWAWSSVFDLSVETISKKRGKASVPSDNYLSQRQLHFPILSERRRRSTDQGEVGERDGRPGEEAHGGVEEARDVGARGRELRRSAPRSTCDRAVRRPERRARAPRRPTADRSTSRLTRGSSSRAPTGPAVRRQVTRSRRSTARSHAWSTAAACRGLSPAGGHLSVSRCPGEARERRG